MNSGTHRASWLVSLCVIISSLVAVFADVGQAKDNYLLFHRSIFTSTPPIYEFLNAENSMEASQWIEENSLPEARSVLKGNIGLSSQTFTTVSNYFGTPNPMAHKSVDITASFSSWAKLTFANSDSSDFHEHEWRFVSDFVAMMDRNEITKVVVFPITDGATGKMKGKIMFVETKDGWKIANISTHDQMLSGW